MGSMSSLSTNRRHPGGQIWRCVEAAAGSPRAAVLGKSYSEGLGLVSRFRASGVGYEPGTQVAGRARAARIHGTQWSCVFHRGGWPAVGDGCAGAPGSISWLDAAWSNDGRGGSDCPEASGQIPAEPVWIAGNGPLPLLYATQLLKAGGRIAGFLSTAASGQAMRAMPKLAAAAFSASGELLKGLRWIAGLQQRASYVRHVAEIEALAMRPSNISAT